MSRLINPQFLDENADSRYPFSDSSRLETDTGNVLAVEAIQDAVLHPVGNVLPLFLRRVEVSGLQAVLTVGTTIADLCQADLDLNDPAGTLVLTDSSGRPAGALLCDPDLLRTIQGWGTGSHLFESRAEFVATVQIPSPELGVRGLSAGNALPLTGDVWLVGEDGVILSEADGAVQIDIVGEPLWRRRLCDTIPSFQVPTYVRTINGVSPDEYGNWQLTAGRVLTGKPALRIHPDGGGLLISLAIPER